MNLEDGRDDGTLRDERDHATIVGAVKAAAPSLFVNARTDTARLGAGDLNETARRVLVYADAGADGVFAPGLTDARDLERVVATAPLPVNALLAPGAPTVRQLGELGVARVSCGSLLFRVALAAATQTLRDATAGEDLTAVPAMAYDDVQTLAS